MKKKLLFVTLYLHTGGVEKSLLSLLSSLDYDKYDVDLLLFDHNGVLFNEVPPQVNILPPLFKTFSTPLLKAAPELIRGGQYRLLTGKLLAAFFAKVSKGVGTGSRWTVYRYILDSVNKHYDVAISYLDFFCNYYVTEKVSADKKIVYNHMDYTYGQKGGWPCPRLERKSFTTSNYIVSVAESACQSLQTYFPEFSDKMRVIHNTVSFEHVQSLAMEVPDPEFVYRKSEFKILTVARLVEEKGVYLAMHACKILIEKGYDIIWFIVGGGPLLRDLEIQSKILGLERHFVLLGEQANPYPYIKRCDVYVQPSKTEAHCVAVEEAIALSRPIVVTNIPSFQYQIQNNKSGIVVTMDADGIAKGVSTCLDSQELREQLSSHLNRFRNRNKEELGKFYELVES